MPNTVPNTITQAILDDKLAIASKASLLVKMNPSIKNESDNEQLWAALCDGTIDIVATDHAPHTMEEKQQPYPACPSGLPAV
ncbi:UNVERIFIED_CONTAM: hypothetical protein GTU68_048466, partial [Idotea baltica]|nr:hypothetical protein [Idotea baltica]